jgi:hypothetical protein
MDNMYRKLATEAFMPFTIGYLSGYLLLQYLARVIMPINLFSISDVSNSLYGWVALYIEFLITAVIIIPFAWFLVSKLLKVSTALALVLTAFGMCLFQAWASGIFSLNEASDLLTSGALLSYAQLLTIFVLFFISFKVLNNNSHNKSLKKGRREAAPLS